MKNIKKVLTTLLIICHSVFFSQSIPPYLPSSGLMAWWPYNGNANDESGNGHNGVISSATLTTDRFGNSNSAYSFNGISSSIAVQDNLNFRPSSFTISSWIYLNNLVGTGMVLAKNCGTSIYESIGSYLNASKLNSIIGTASSYGQFLATPNVLQNGQWYHFVDQFDDVNNVHRLFLNGVMTYSLIESISVGYDGKPWTIGMEYENTIPTFYFSGKIDDIGIWDRVLNTNEIIQVYQGALTNGLGEPKTNNSLEVFPNPCSEQLNIKTVNMSDLNKHYALIDYTGREIVTGTIETDLTSLNMDKLGAGIYVLRINNERSLRILKK